MISAEGSSLTNNAVFGSYGGRSSPSGGGPGTTPATTPWNQCHAAPPRCSTSPAGVQPDGTTGRCHASSSSPATIASTASRWAARKTSRAWSCLSSIRLAVMSILRVVVVVEQFDGLVLASQRRQVQEDVGLAQQVGDRAVAGPGVQHGVAIAEEDADAALLAGPGGPGFAPVGQLLRGPEVVLDGRHALVVRHVEVVVEVASLRRIPREGPAHPLPERLDLADRRPGHRGVRGLVGMQVGQVTDAVGLVGADRTTLVPSRVEHEVLHDELRPALEQVQQAGLALGALEDVLLLDLDGRHLAAPARDLLQSAYGLLLGGLQLLARGHPLGGRDDSRTQCNLQEMGWLRVPPLRGWTDTVAGTHRHARKMLQGGSEAEVREQLGKHIAVQTGDEAAIGLQHLKRPRVVAAAAVRAVLREGGAPVRRGGQQPGPAALRAR